MGLVAPSPPNGQEINLYVTFYGFFNSKKRCSPMATCGIGYQKRSSESASSELNAHKSNSRWANHQLARTATSKEPPINTPTR